MFAGRILLGALLSAGVAIAQNSTSKPSVIIPACFWNKLVRYAYLSEASLYNQLHHGCPTPVYNTVLVDTISINSTDTQASIFRDDVREEFIVSFPGTSSAQDFKTDENATLVAYVSPGVNCPGCKAHAGFLGAWNSVLPAIQAGLDPALKQYPCYTVTVTGHSLGGALAALAYPSLKGLDYPVTRAYTYGQPRIGDVGVANYIDSLSGASDTRYGEFRRVTHSYDGVPNLPPVSLGYAHPRTEFFQEDVYISNGTLINPANETDATAGLRTQTAHTTYRCFGQDSLYCNTKYGVGFINQAHVEYSGIAMVGGVGCAAINSTMKL